LEQFKTSSHYVLASPQPKENVTITVLSHQYSIIDEIWLEFAGKGLLTDLTNYTEKWGRTPDWFQSNLDGGVYKGKTYGIRYGTDVMGIWYWNDLLSRAKIDPNMLRT
jgi:multiple sugar transport system substrate-binding protein